MANKVCSSKCVGEPGRRAAQSRLQPRVQSTGSRSQIPQPQYSRSQIRPMGPPRTRTAIPQPSQPPGQLRREQTRVQSGLRRPPGSNVLVPFGQQLTGAGGRSQIPGPRYTGTRQRNQPTVIVNTTIPTLRRGERGVPGRNDININIRLLIEAVPNEGVEERELEEFEALEREMEELDEFERLERQCQLECPNAAGPAQVFDVVPMTPPKQTGRRGANFREFLNRQREITSTGTMRSARKEQDRFEALARQAANLSGISSCGPPEFESPMTEAEILAMSDPCPAWDNLANQSGSMLENECMMDNTFDRAMWADTGPDNSGGWRQACAAAQDVSDLENASFNYESPGCC